MQNILIPTGKVFFTGDYSALLHAISVGDGTLGDSENYKCVIPFPSRRFKDKHPFIRIRGGLSWSFHCSYTRCRNGYEITYKVYPGMSAVFVLLFMFVTIFTVLSSLSTGDYQQLMPGAIVVCLLLVLCLFTRAMCIREFIQVFERKS